LNWNIERVIPKEMDIVSSQLQRLSLKNHLQRYHVACNWLAGHFNGRKIRVLDLACGTGFGSEILSDVGKVVGVDISEKSVGYANRHYRNGNTSFKLGNADNKSFLESLGEFDAVVSLETIEHLEDHYAYLKWVNKALRPAGALVVSFPSTFTMDWAVPHHKRDISRSAARRLFAECGFEIVNRFNQGDHLPIRHMLSELRTTPDVPTPPLSQWVKYYLRRPDHLLRRIHQMTVGGGILLAHQQYLLEPIRAD
jgi:2-polyprenyl-3-methyl-5-hydroxy-6-metoxy-1,4-benzoquinol methylase